MLTLEEVLNLPIMKNSQLVSGGATGKIVESISVLEVPKATKFIKPNELLISSFYSISDDVDQQVELVKRLKLRGICGLIICHKGIILKDISNRLIQVCIEIDLPLVIAAPDISYYNIISPIMDILLEKKNYILKNSLDIQNLFIRSMTKSTKIDSILNILKSVLDRDFFYIDYEFNYLYKSNSMWPNSKLENISHSIKSNLDKILHQEHICLELDDNWLVTTVTSAQNIHGFLIILHNHSFSEIDIVAISQTKNCLSIVSIHEINMKEYLMSVRKNYLVELFFSNSNIGSNQVTRGKSLGYDIENLRQALIIDIYNFNSVVAKNNESFIASLKKDLLRRVVSCIGISHNDYMIFEYSDKIILFIYDYENNPAKFTNEMNVIGNYIASQINNEQDIKVSIGIGQYYNDYKQIGTSVEEAISAIKVSNKIYGSPRCTFYGDIAIFDVILGSIDKDKALNITTDLFYNLKTYDEMNNTDLLSTAIILFKHCNNTVIAADYMYVHKNTILQRKRKITELLNEDPFNEENYLKYNLAALLLNYYEQSDV
ncbi:MAG: PucR family transcriptional regulator ligand-binding domain-containing protein [Bacillota bacterium]|nr:PucR family transcriptional regulator ligand-binding domain-containing protein [Bacillota bacterium]